MKWIHKVDCENIFVKWKCRYPRWYISVILLYSYCFIDSARIYPFINYQSKEWNSFTFRLSTPFQLHVIGYLKICFVLGGPIVKVFQAYSAATQAENTTTAGLNPGKGLFHKFWKSGWRRQASCPLNPVPIILYIIITNLVRFMIANLETNRWPGPNAEEKPEFRCGEGISDYLLARPNIRGWLAVRCSYFLHNNKDRMRIEPTHLYMCQ